jgi:small conductance mechanosensitive channel
MDFKRTTDIQVVQNTNHITLDDQISNEAIINWTIEDPSVIWPIDVGIGYMPISTKLEKS